MIFFHLVLICSDIELPNKGRTNRIYSFLMLKQFFKYVQFIRKYLEIAFWDSDSLRQTSLKNDLFYQ